MSDDLLQAVQDYVEENIGSFHDKRLETVKDMRLNYVLKRKNPYLFKAKAQDATQLIRSILDAFLSSQEETLFGEFLEGVAIFVTTLTYAGFKPSTEELTGIDLVFERDGTVFIVDIKSGPNWGNDSQKQKMYRNFRESIARLESRYPNQKIIPVNGCMYGKNRKRNRVGKIKEEGEVIYEVDYFMLCGQDFWNFISGNPQLYVDIIHPLGYRAIERNEHFQKEYGNFISKMTREFLIQYADEHGGIAWEKLTRFVSESKAIYAVSNMTLCENI